MWLREETLFREELVGGSGQAHIFAQRLSFIFLSKQSTVLQHRHETVNKIVYTLRYKRKLYSKAVTAASHQPFFHLIGNLIRRTHKAEA